MQVVARVQRSDVIVVNSLISRSTTHKLGAGERKERKKVKKCVYFAEMIMYCAITLPDYRCKRTSLYNFFMAFHAAIRCLLFFGFA